MSAEPAPRRRRLGEILVELGLLAERDLERVLGSQQGRTRRLGDVLLEEGLVTPPDLLKALAVQFGLAFVDLDDVSVDLELARKVPVALARRHRAVPLARNGERIVVAMANPADVFALDDLKQVLRADLEPVLADPGQITATIDKAAESDQEVADLIRLAVDERRPRDEVAAPLTISEPAGGEDAPIVRFVDLMVQRAVQERASDIHVEPTPLGLRVRLRIDGVLQEALKAPRELQAGVLSRIKVMADIDIGERRLPQDGRTSMVVGGRTIDLRVATVPTVHGEAIVIRLLDRSGQHSRLSDLGFLPAQLERWKWAYERPWGALVVTGPTGSGKTTTLYSTLRELNDPSRNIITVEDPVEYRLEGIKQVQVNARAGLTFATALRSFLRADPDVILVGEVRDRETATIAVEASLTGHLVLTTLHTNDAASSPLRLLEMGVEPFLVTSSVHAVLAQRLARRLCDRCREPYEATERELVAASIDPALLAVPGAAAGPLVLHRAVGCRACSGTGYRGRFAIHEVLVVTEEISRLVLDRASSASVAALAVEQGMVTLRRDGLQKVARGLTTVEELLRVLG